MNYNQALTLVHTDTGNMSLAQLKEYKSDLISAWYESRAEYGIKRAVENGFYVPIQTDSSEGYVPQSFDLTKKIETAIAHTEKSIHSFYKSLLIK